VLRSRRSRLLGTAGLALAAVVGLAAPAAAHAQLVSTDPAAGAAVAHSPGRVVLHFSEPVEVSFGSIRVFDHNGHRVDAGRPSHPGGDSHTVAVAVPASLGDGGFVVTWRVVSADSHPVHGAFTFRIGASAGSTAGATAAATDAATAVEAAALLRADTGSKVVGVTLGVIRFAEFTALALLIGAALVLGLAWPAGVRRRSLRWLLWIALGFGVLATVSGVAVQGPYAGGLPLVDSFHPSVVSNVLHTRFGELSALRLGLLVVAIPLMVGLVRGRRLGGRWAAAASATALALLLTVALGGHAGVGSQVALAVAFDVVHLGAVAVWVGGLAVLGLALVPGADPPLPPEVVMRFSQWALGAAAAVLISGAFASWRQVGTWSALTTTAYGRLLVAKTVSFVALVGVASLSRRTVHGSFALPWLRPRVRAVGLSPGPGAEAANLSPPMDVESRRLLRTIALELAAMVVLFALTSALVNALPARAALARPYSTEVHAGPNVLVDAVVDPAKAGPLAVHLYTLSAEGSQLDVPEVLATLSLPGRGIDPIHVPLSRAGIGHFVAYGLDVPIRGTWELDVRVRTSEFDEVVAEPIHVDIR
jgi:copper transport protein